MAHSPAEAWMWCAAPPPSSGESQLIFELIVT
jgi:hypothetical protein